MEAFDMSCSESNVIHEDVLLRVREKMPNEDPIYEVSELFKVFGDSTRARMICALNIEEMCVCDLAALLNMTQSAISHQLRILKSSRLVKSRKQGKIVYYSLDDSHIGDIFAKAFEHVMEEMEG
ncbi:MAG: metalloregulator ArsR/SmtB family transcription factor [Oscillospiraceae bacterium]|nr:metalloregulator ArsR/SmtB family transcription factor [Oscillospiraceae bacterium]